jgi:hypothetical protein
MSGTTANCETGGLPQGQRGSLRLQAFVDGKLVWVKSLEPDGRIHLQDGRILPSQFRQFVRGYAVTLGLKGKPSSTFCSWIRPVKAATNNQQRLVTISSEPKASRFSHSTSRGCGRTSPVWGAGNLRLNLSNRMRRGLTPAVRNYIQRLIQTRRVDTPQQNKRSTPWKQNLDQRVKHQQARGQRI